MRHSGLLILLLAVLLTGCGAGNSDCVPFTPPETVPQLQTEEAVKEEEETVQKEMLLMINETVVPVRWEDNASAAELAKWVSEEPLRIDLNMYGGWEQVGSLGRSISRKDVQLTAGNGDIMLYSGNQIVLFYGENTWAYTKLGHIELPAEEITALLSTGAVHITLAVQ